MAETDLAGVLGPELAGAIAKKGYTTLTPVQEAVLDPALAGRDLRISSQTGSGKTIAIGFIVRESVQGDASPSPKGAARPLALVVAPTRELAKQVELELSWLFAPLRVKVASVTGGGNYRDERRALGSGTAIVVGTPGRLLDHLQRGAIDGSQLGAVVLDEADRMLDLGFRDDLEAILGFAPPGHRTHLVSATFPREVTTLANRVQTDAARIEGTPHGSANTDIEHLVHLVLPNQRLDAIVNLMLETPDATTLIFARTRADVGELTHLLAEAGFVVDSLSGEMEQRERNKALAAFKRGDLDALVATDVAARGIDVQDVARVLHAEPPMDPDSYTHRSGRTGRAGRKGKSSVLVTPPALMRVSSLLKRAGVRWRIDPVPTAETIEAAREDRLFADLTMVVPPPDDAAEDLAEAPEGFVEADDRSWAIAKRITEAGEATRSLARLIARTRSRGPEARAITVLHPPGARKKPWEERGASAGAGAGASAGAGPSAGAGATPGPGARGFGERRPFAEHRTFGEPRGLRPDRASERSVDGAAPARDNGPSTRLPSRTTARDPETDAGSWVAFRVSWGQIHGADARRLLAMVCRRGGIRGSDVGAIRVARTFSTVNVAAAAATDFERASREPDPRDPRVKILREDAVAHGAEAPREAEAPPRETPPREAPPREVEAEVEADRPSRTARKVEADRPSRTARKVEADRPSRTAKAIEAERPSKTAAKAPAAKSGDAPSVDRPSRSAYGDRRPRPSQPERYSRRPQPTPGTRPPYEGPRHEGPRPPNDRPRPPNDRARPPNDRPRPPNDRARPSNDRNDRPRPPYDGPRPAHGSPRPHPTNDRARPNAPPQPSRHGDARPKRKKP